MTRKKEFVMSKNDLAYVEPIDECFTDGFAKPQGQCIASFNFFEDANAIFTNEIDKELPSTTSENHDNRKNPGANGSTPPIDEKLLNVKKTYYYRKTS